MQSIDRAARRRSRRELAKHPQWGTLEEFARSRIQSWLQDVLEEEVTELLGRGKSERRAVVDAPAGYRNGHGKTRRLSMMAGTIEVKRPRVRGLEQRFESRLLPLFVRRTAAVSEPDAPMAAATAKESRPRGRTKASSLPITVSAPPVFRVIAGPGQRQRRRRSTHAGSMHGVRLFPRPRLAGREATHAPKRRNARTISAPITDPGCGNAARRAGGPANQ